MQQIEEHALQLYRRPHLPRGIAERTLILLHTLFEKLQGSGEATFLFCDVLMSCYTLWAHVLSQIWDGPLHDVVPVYTFRSVSDVHPGDYGIDVMCA